jgi:hypothetical protein
MTYVTDQVVKVKNANGEMVDGAIMQQADFNNGEVLWWVRYPESSHYEIGLISEDNLKQWNTIPTTECTCGSKIANSPAHAYWCDMNSSLSA